MKKGGKAFNFAVMVAMIMFLAINAQAADVSIGGGLGIAPEYEGSDDYVPVPVPVARVTAPGLPRLSWSRYRSIRSLADSVSVNRMAPS